MNLRCRLAVAVLVGIAGLSLCSRAWPAPAAAPPPGNLNAADVDFLKAVVVVELSPAVPLPKSGDGKLIGAMFGQDGATILSEATAALKKGLAPLQVSTANAVQGAGNQAAAQGAAYLVHVLIKDRRADISLGMGSPSYILKADTTIYRSPALKGGNPTGPWQKSVTVPLESKGFESQLGSHSEYAGLALQVLGLVMRDICPIQILGCKPAGGKVQVTLAAVNNTTKDITGLTLAVPSTNPYICQTGSASETIAPGAKKVIAVEVSLPYSHDGKTDLKFNQAYISGVRFGAAAALPTRPQPKAAAR